MNLDGRLAAALQRWASILQPRGVVTGDGTREFQTCPSGHQQNIAAVLFPETAEDVQRIVAVSADQRIPLYPISVGNNWGYGSSAPPLPGSVVLNLSRMNKILSFDEVQGIVTLEPGVSQQALYDFLGRHGHQFFVPITGSSPRSSIVGNALERGFGITPHVDHFGAVIALEAVLPDGQVYKSAMYEAREGFDVASHRWGIGPYIDGLFGQGSFGIVTKVVLQLAKRTPASGTMLAVPRDGQALFDMVEAARQLLQESGLGAVSIKFINDLYVAATSHGPLQQVTKPVSVQARRELRARLGIPEWTCWMGVYGNAGTIKLARSLVRKFIRPLSSKVYFFSDQNIRQLERLSTILPARIFSKTHSQITALVRGQRYIAGEPNEGAFRMAYWRSGRWHHDTPNAPIADGCAFSWYAPLVPFKQTAVRTFVDLAERACAEVNVDPIMNFTAISSGCFYGLVVLTFDEGSSSEARIAAYRHIFQEGAKVGLIPYRVPAFAASDIARAAPKSFDLASRLKRAVDPHGIMAPGRYELPPSAL